MNVPFVAVHLAVYESAKKFMSGHKEESLAVQLVAGGMAGGTAAALTNPLDMVKTRLQLEGVNSATKYGTTHVVSATLVCSNASLKYLFMQAFCQVIESLDSAPHPGLPS